MKLPKNKNAVISSEKLTNYVLSETHATGKFKAKFFRNLGFDKTNISFFEKALYKLTQSQEVTNVETSPYGTKYIIDGEIQTPKGRAVSVRTVWIIEKYQKGPRFVTIYPI